MDNPLKEIKREMQKALVEKAAKRNAEGPTRTGRRRIVVRFK